MRQAGACYWLEPEVPVWREWLTVRDVRRLHLSRHFDAIDGWAKAREHADPLAGELVRRERALKGVPDERIEAEAATADLRYALEARRLELPPTGQLPSRLYPDPDWEPSSAYFQSLSMAYDSPRVRRAVERALSIRKSQVRHEGSET